MVGAVACAREFLSAGAAGVPDARAVPAVVREVEATDAGAAAVLGAPARAAAVAVGTSVAGEPVRLGADSTGSRVAPEPPTRAAVGAIRSEAATSFDVGVDDTSPLASLARGAFVSSPRRRKPRPGILLRACTSFLNMIESATSSGARMVQPSLPSHDASGNPRARWLAESSRLPRGERPSCPGRIRGLPSASDTSGREGSSLWSSRNENRLFLTFCKDSVRFAPAVRLSPRPGRFFPPDVPREVLRNAETHVSSNVAGSYISDLYRRERIA